ncbi:SIS domain-containing protein [Chitinophaga alhagiae]|uniref:SIS domain-containing protein n=1 Tax=Chitinophaga alhagiae TaxID=2203219 RepID=UPI0013006282|nr:SIS domain-containing protein [Chitinophaga alhagiae]
MDDNKFQNLDFSKATYLGYTHEALKMLGGIHTAREIDQQPELWLKTTALLAGCLPELRAFLGTAFSEEKLEVILTGAGSSAYIGSILKGPFQKNTGKHTRAIGTTELLTHPLHYFNEQDVVLLVSFARSGNSPESVAVLELADRLCKKVYHLIVTCSATGRLAMSTGGENEYLFLLPGQADDQSLVMTSSFTSMLLAGLALSRLEDFAQFSEQVDILAAYGRKVIQEYAPRLKEVAALDFRRAIFLGSGALQGTAEEAQLKMLEMTAGSVIGKSDSFLAFRHGPKAVIDASSLMVYLFSNEPYSLQYEKDLVAAVNAGERGLYSIGVMENGSQVEGLDLEISLTGPGKKIDEALLAVCGIVPVQVLGFYKSLQCGLRPDNPSDSGTITRIVQGVNIYPFNRNIQED